jgi:SAM-dependent methyltransferase
MLLRFARDHYASDVASSFLAPAAELILDALPPLQPQSRFLDVQAGGGILARPLVERIAGLGQLVAVEHDPMLVMHLPSATARAARLRADLARLPFAPGTFDVCIANLVLGDRSEDPLRLQELRRVVRPGGWLLATLLLRGSFDELLDVLTEACEAAGLMDERQALEDARAGLFDENALSVFNDAGFVPAHVGVEERGVFFDNGRAALADPLVREVLVPSWLQGREATAEVWARAAGALDAYFGASRFAVRIRTAVVTGRPR